MTAGRKRICGQLLFLYGFQVPGNVIQKKSFRLFLTDFITVQKISPERKEDGIADIQPFQQFFGAGSTAVFRLVGIEGDCLIKMYVFPLGKTRDKAVMAFSLIFAT